MIAVESAPTGTVGQIEEYLRQIDVHDQPTVVFDRIAWSDTEVADLTGTSRSWVQARISDGTFDTVKFGEAQGARRLVTTDSFARAFGIVAYRIVPRLP